jgi:hypothetical protein
VSNYVCSRYLRRHHDVTGEATCGHHGISADLLLRFVVRKLQEVYLGPGRAGLVEDIKAELRSQTKTSDSDAQRLEKRLAELDTEMGRLVKAIRYTDAPELVQALNEVRAERQSIQDALQRAGHLQAVEDFDQEAERLADGLWTMAERLDEGDPAVLREILTQAVARIECQWDHQEQGGRMRCLLIGGTVEFRRCGGFPALSPTDNDQSAWRCPSRLRPPRSCLQSRATRASRKRPCP